ncbi:hypothetical protein FisN_1Hu603 [Fistulifera solaris]|jgi:hypothetical protein|uniref:Uncharacterized protein n=1 Tax=Fistulifera solaris TaxID=1519565 RepID=A0A1Z5KQM6_FISSO|nr:hypothetical protein FisN_1Hu603 [Fistulifera solaris]|eukprot:GAX28606.1 hypothetical protein FisN_1Hu603 [Fistulifera solaris]
MTPTLDQDSLKTATAVPAAFQSTEEMIEYLQQTQVVDMNAEDMDPLEWTFRKVVPIPEHYYWDVVSNKEDQAQIPARIRFWHRSLYALSCASQWTDDHIGQPLARSLGLHTPRMNDVTMFMSDDDWKRSQRIVAERQNQEIKEDSSQTTTSKC